MDEAHIHLTWKTKGVLETQQGETGSPLFSKARPVLPPVPVPFTTVVAFTHSQMTASDIIVPAKKEKTLTNKSKEAGEGRGAVHMDT